MRVDTEKPTSVRLHSDLLGRLKVMAAENERSIAWCINQILRKHFVSIDATTNAKNEDRRHTLR